jgi:copper(I)-binding protein
VLRAAQSDACGMVMLHKSSRGGGMATMSDVPEVKLAPHETVKFEPGSYHLMCMDPRPR